MLVVTMMAGKACCVAVCLAADVLLLLLLLTRPYQRPIRRCNGSPLTPKRRQGKGQSLHAKNRGVCMRYGTGTGLACVVLLQDTLQSACVGECVGT